MAVHLKRTLITFAILVVIMQITRGQDESPIESEEVSNSSSDETAEEQETSEELHKPHRRSLETSTEGSVVDEAQAKAGLPAIPGLPDAETIIKIAEVLTTVGQQVLPLIVSGNSRANDLLSNRLLPDMKFYKKFKNEIDILSGELKKYK